MSEDKPKATKTYLKEIQQIIKGLEETLGEDTTSKLVPEDQLLKEGEKRSNKYKMLVTNVQVSEEDKEKFRKLLENRRAEEARVKKELGIE
jgi:hypothetical protein